ncbi:hypothetical protein Tco_1459204 [Tanacetum coccineum]
MKSVKKSIDKRALHKREYDSKVNERQMHTTAEKVDTSKVLDASLVDTKSSGTESEKQDTNSRSGNDAHADDADIRPIYDEEPMAEVQLIVDHNVFATEQQHIEQPEFNNEGEVDQNAEQFHDIHPLSAKLTDNQTTKLSNQSLESKNTWQHGQFSKVKSNEAKVKYDIDVMETINIELEHKLAKLLKENETLKKHYKELKPVLQPHRNQSVVREPTAFKSERPRISKQRFASQGDVNNDLSKPIITHYLPKERDSVVVKPHHVIASSESRNSSKNMPRFISKDMVHNYYLDEARKNTQRKDRNSEPSVMPSARSQSTTNGSKPKPRSNTQTSRN